MKRKILACVLACATLFLGMGYAYWTDSLQIDTTATTGELEVNFVDLAVYGQYAGVDHEDGWAIVDGIDEDGYDGVTPDWYFDRDTNYNIIATADELAAYNDRIWGYTQTEFDADLFNPANLEVTVGPYTTSTAASDTITIDLKKIYPGFAQIFQADVVNTGTIAAKLADLKLTIGQTVDPAILDMIGVNFKVLREYAGDPSEGHVDVFNTVDLSTDDFFNLAGVDFIRLSALDDLLAAGEIIENDLLYVLPDDNRMDVYIGIAMDPDKDGEYTTGWSGDINTDNNDDNTELGSTSFQIQFLWDQFNIDNPSDGETGQLEEGM